MYHSTLSDFVEISNTICYLDHSGFNSKLRFHKWMNSTKIIICVR